MAQSRSFGSEYMFGEFDKISSYMSNPIHLYIIGGGGLIRYGLKEVTKDLDVVLIDSRELDELIKALKITDYSSSASNKVSRSYRKMRTQIILENGDGFRWDIFYKQVCRALTFSNEMKSRVLELYAKSQLKVFVASR